MSTENADQRDIIRSIKAESGYAKKWATPYTVGVPDIVGALPDVGNFLLEVKTPRGSLSRKQIYELEQNQKAGGLSLVAIVHRKIWLELFEFGRPPQTITCWWKPSFKIYMNIRQAILKVKNG